MGKKEVTFVPRENITIGNVLYEIAEEEGLFIGGDRLFGSVLHGQCKITIEKSMSMERKEQVIWHEVIHALLSQAGLNVENEEIIAEVISHGIYGIIKDHYSFMLAHYESR